MEVGLPWGYLFSGVKSDWRRLWNKLLFSCMARTILSENLDTERKGLRWVNVALVDGLKRKKPWRRKWSKGHWVHGGQAVFGDEWGMNECQGECW